MQSDTFKKIKNIYNINKNYEIPCLRSDDEVITDQAQKLTLLGQHFASNFKDNPGNIPGNRARQIENAVSSFTANIEPIAQFGSGGLASGTNNATHENFTNSEEILAIIESLNNKKSSGPDAVPNFILKKLKPFFSKFLTIILNHCINNCYFPNYWKNANIVPIPKPGKPSDTVTGYRPISMLSNISKIMEKCLHGRINKHLIENNILNDHQMGFRKQHSSNHPLFVFTDFVASNLKLKRSTLACFLDINTAFDSVWINGLIYKLILYNFNKHLIILIKSFLENRTFQVWTGSNSSSTFRIFSGVPQGSILGPTLYNIFLSDIPEPPPDIHILCYADDVVVYTAGVRMAKVNRNINTYLNQLNDYYEAWKGKINLEKTTALLVTGVKASYRNMRRIKPVVKIKNNTISVNPTAKYLGVTFDNKFNFCQHIKAIIRKSQIALALYGRALRQKKHLTTHIKKIVYKQVIRPIISYGFPTWFQVSSANMEQLRILERKCLRYACNMGPVIDVRGFYRLSSNKEVYKTAGIERIDKFLVELGRNFTNNLENIDNNKIEQIRSRNEILNINQKYISPKFFNFMYNNVFFNNDNNITFYNKRYSNSNVGIYSMEQ